MYVCTILVYQSLLGYKLLDLQWSVHLRLERLTCIELPCPDCATLWLVQVLCEHPVLFAAFATFSEWL